MTNSISFSEVLNTPVGFGVAKEVIEASVKRLSGVIALLQSNWETIGPIGMCEDDFDAYRMHTEYKGPENVIFQHEHPDFQSETFLPADYWTVEGIKYSIQELQYQLKEMIEE